MPPHIPYPKGNEIYSICACLPRICLAFVKPTHQFRQKFVHIIEGWMQVRTLETTQCWTKVDTKTSKAIICMRNIERADKQSMIEFLCGNETNQTLSNLKWEYSSPVRHAYTQKRQYFLAVSTLLLNDTNVKPESIGNTRNLFRKLLDR